MQNGLAGGHHHDGEDEHRLGEITLVQVVNRRVLSENDAHDDDQYHRPDAEHHLHFAEQMENAGMLGVPMRQPGEIARRKRMQDGANEQGGRHPLENRMGHCDCAFLWLEHQR